MNTSPFPGITRVAPGWTAIASIAPTTSMMITIERIVDLILQASFILLSYIYPADI